MSRSRALRAFLGLLAAALGMAALAGWTLGSPLLATFGRGNIPMSPMSALLFVVFGLALGLRGALAGSPMASRASLLLVLACGLITAGLLVQSILGLHSFLDNLGLSNQSDFPGTLSGRTSPVTALCFALSCLSFLASSRSGRISRSLLSLTSAYLVLAACLVFLLAYLFGQPLLYGESRIPPAFPTILAFSSLGLALASSAHERLGAFAGSTEPGLERTSYLIPTVVFFAVGSLFAAYLYYQGYEARVRVEIVRQLESVSNLKAEGLRQYRRERLGDASFILGNPSFSALVSDFFRDPEGEAGPLLDSWLRSDAYGSRYDRVYLLDAEGRVRLSSRGLPQPLSTFLSGSLSLSLATSAEPDRPEFQDFYRDEGDGKIYLAILVPISDPGPHHRRIGTVVLRVDPQSYIDPFMRGWPTSSPSAETLLLRREGDQALFLNDLKFKAEAALRLHVPLSNLNIPAAKAARGGQGTVEGRDYRGVPVIAYTRPVPDSPWFIVAKMDRAEALAPLRERLWLMIGLMLLLLLGAAASLISFSRSQRLRFYREKYQTSMALQETSTFLESLIACANAPIVVWDSLFRLIRVNHAFEALTGKASSELLGSALTALVPPDRADAALGLLRETARGRHWEAIEIDIVGASGEARTVLWNSAPIHAPDGAGIVATVAQGQDISGIKEAEGRLLEQLEELKRWQSVMLGRESRVLELKWEVNELLLRSGSPPRYRESYDE
jgi:PAS domain S-box-containing protein